jgi:hypothetical protein
VLESITLQPPLLVIEVLPPTGVIGADRLQVSIGNRADPYLLPSRRDDQQLAALDLFCGEPVPGLIEIDEPLPGATTRPTGISR